MIYDLEILVRIHLDLIVNLLLIITSISLVAIVYSLFNYNPMYSLLFFILFLFNLVISLFLQNYEFVGLLLGLIYFGAILILFFFILLLVNLQIVTRDNLHLKRVALNLIPLSSLVYLIIFKGKTLGLFIAANNFNKIDSITTLENISLTLFNDFGLHIIIVGLILFITLIGLVIILVSNKNIKINFYRKSI